jgi:hypothetical protein
VAYFKVSFVPDSTSLRGLYKTAIILKVAGDIAPAAERVCCISFRYFGIARVKQEVIVIKKRWSATYT